MTGGRPRSAGGRRPGETLTRDAILEAAMESFTAQGYSATTVRGVARAAGVDPALVIHFFGTKDGLFDAAVRIRDIPLRGLSEAVEGDPGLLGERLVRRYLSIWEDPEAAPLLYAILKAAATSEAAAELLRHFMTEEILVPIAKRLGIDHAETRATLAGSQLIGLALMRYILKVDAIAGVPAETIVRAVGPTVQRYLTGDLTLT
ncbi:TetR/AcrR family transcriptional regulator [Sphaerisporangium album]|uniref:TetR/AcrR family transcriptional regulator n=1 Tax=Sphaerisporangium album TaxID=509200 RepID=A0A367FPF8_9ACTN|nr:TetR family transcriptional regulator [Sphaerisporangium album]RCG31597.1 TetR/AcrR family transcriptional regulator [Sphaerisporangium album]